MKVGDVVRIVNTNELKDVPIEVGNTFLINYIDGVEPCIQILINEETWWIYSENVVLDKFNETEEFFNFLHPNIEITYRKELFDKLYKQFKQETK